MARPKAIEKYTFREKMKIILLPVRKGFNTIRGEDLPTLKTYRRLWLLVWGLLALRVALAAGYGYLSKNPNLMASLGEI